METNFLMSLFLLALYKIVKKKCPANAAFPKFTVECIEMWDCGSQK